MTGPDRRDLLDALLISVNSDQNPVTHVERLPARVGRTVPWPGWADADLVSALRSRRIDAPYAHQSEAAELAWSGGHVVISTGTASGKSLAYQLPAITRLRADPRATVLHLSPTKALAGDQLQSLTDLQLAGLQPALFDGDTPMANRDWVRSYANWVLTNPDMIHRGILPHHARWARMLRNLAYVVVDECHAYRGVFGSHVALVLRRLRRIARMYGADPVFVLASATVAEPAVSASRLIGAPVREVTGDAAPRAGADFVLWEPPILPDLTGENGAPVRRSAPAEAARMLADLVAAGARTLAFVRSRHGAETTAMAAQRRLTDTHPELIDRIAAYRGGYLPEERRALERALSSGELLGVASTNALELGMDIAGLDAAVLAGYPGTIASLWQQAGRAGRGADRALVVFVARDDPLDTYLVHHPEALFGRAVEAAITDPGNPHILGPHLACAAVEKHLTEQDLELFGGVRAEQVMEELVDQGTLRARSTGWYPTDRRHPADAVDLRGSGAGQVAVVESATARMLGTVEGGRAGGSVHPGAVYLHRGASYVVDSLDLEQGVAWVHPEKPDWTTSPRSISSVSIISREVEREHVNGIRTGSARVEVTEQVVGYLRRRPGGEMLDQVPLDLPEQVLDTRAVWYSIPLSTLITVGLTESRVPGSLHAAEHAAIGLLPFFAGCDRWDIGGLSTNLHPDTGEPTVLVYDGYPGGAGFADRGFDVLGEWLEAVLTVVRGCACPAGCPSCVQSPKCGNGNNPLDKSGAVAVLELMVRSLAAGSIDPAPAGSTAATESVAPHRRNGE